MASEDEVTLSECHPPHKLAKEAYNHVLHQIKHAVIKSRHDWNKHEPKMWARAKDLTDEQLTHFTVEDDLVEIRTGPTSYGTIIFGKIKIHGFKDEEGEGYLHVRVHDPPDRGVEDVVFHSIYTEVGGKSPEGHPTIWRAIHTLDKPLKFFNE